MTGAKLPPEVVTFLGRVALDSDIGLRSTALMLLYRLGGDEGRKLARQALRSAAAEVEHHRSTVEAIANDSYRKRMKLGPYARKPKKVLR